MKLFLLATLVAVVSAAPKTTTVSYVDEPILPSGISCANVRCSSGTRCEDLSDGPECVPLPTCEVVDCATNHICEMQNGEPVCVPQGGNTGGTGCAAVTCLTGKVCFVDGNGDGVCVDPPPTGICALTLCAAGLNCVETDSGEAQCVAGGGNCDNFPCEPGFVCQFDEVPKCVPSCAAVSCLFGQSCEIHNGVAQCKDNGAALPTTKSYVDEPISPPGADSCSDGEEWTECGTCDKYCDGRQIKCVFSCQKKCQCKPGYKRDSNDKCVKTCAGSAPSVPAHPKFPMVKRTSPVKPGGSYSSNPDTLPSLPLQTPPPKACPANEIYTTCGTACEPTCGVERTFCTLQCIVNVCQCAPGFRREKAGSGACIPEADCPAGGNGNNSNKCPFGEELKSCGTACEPTCGVENPICTEQCLVDVCQCIAGYRRETEGGPCVPENRCPIPIVPATTKSSVKLTFPTRSFNPTGSTPSFGKHPTAPPKGNYADEPVLPSVPFPHILPHPDTGATAPKQCGENEELKECGTACEPKCGVNNLACIALCIPNVCQCKNGYRRDNGKCIAAEQCPQGVPTIETFPPNAGGSTPPKTCGANEHFLQCGTNCEPKCGEPDVLVCNRACKLNVCQCLPGFKRDSTGNCVSKEQCGSSSTTISYVDEPILPDGAK